MLPKLHRIAEKLREVGRKECGPRHRETSRLFQPSFFKLGSNFLWICILIQLNAQNFYLLKIYLHLFEISNRLLKFKNLI